jgi:hypothetical protein
MREDMAPPGDSMYQVFSEWDAAKDKVSVLLSMAKKFIAPLSLKSPSGLEVTECVLQGVETP